jgi:hypothetical protein
VKQLLPRDATAVDDVWSKDRQLVALRSKPLPRIPGDLTGTPWRQTMTKAFFLLSVFSSKGLLPDASARLCCVAARPLESEYQKQNLRHCCGGKLPLMVSMSSTGQEILSPWFIRIILSSIFLASPSPIATNF